MKTLTKKISRVGTRSVEDYLRLPYTIEITRDTSVAPAVWFARVKELPGCMTEVDSFADVQEMISDGMRSWIAAALADGDVVPEPVSRDKYSGKFVTRVPSSLHSAIAVAASNDGVSLNLWVATQLARAAGQPEPTARAAGK